MSNAKKKKVLILAGPNGAGKTTFAREFLPNEAACPRFINVDLIAEGLSPFDPEIAHSRQAVSWFKKLPHVYAVKNILHLKPL
jgi:predicted ABC-type ATPase